MYIKYKRQKISHLYKVKFMKSWSCNFEI